MTQSCSCCGGGDQVAHAGLSNRPGLSKLDYRLASHGAFHKAMLSRLSSSAYPELHGLRTREASDFSVAFLDACAVVGDVLCFYQERIANEGYLETATERRSLLELSRLIGYVPRPGVSASAYLAYTLEKGSVKADIPKGSKANTIPGPGEDMQAFETSEAFTAREEWNAIRPRLTMPQNGVSIRGDGVRAPVLYLKGTATRLKSGDRLLLKISADRATWRVARVQSLEAFETEKHTRVELTLLPAANAPKTADKLDAHQEAEATAGALPAEAQGSAATQECEKQISAFSAGFSSLAKSASVAPAGSKELARIAEDAFKPGQETIARLLTYLQPALATTLYTAWNNLAPANPVVIEAFAMRVEARPFGHNAPLRFDHMDDATNRPVMQEWDVNDPWNTPPAYVPQVQPGTEVLQDSEKVANSPLPQPTDYHGRRTVYLDNEYDISNGGEVVIETENTGVSVISPASAVKGSIAAYGLSGKTVKINWTTTEEGLNPPWLADDRVFAPVRQVRVFAGGEKLDLAERPNDEAICGDSFELNGLYDGIEAGQWLIVSGERTDVKDGAGNSIRGIIASELVMLKSVEQYVAPDGCTAAAGETYHSKITLEAQSIGAEGESKSGLAYCYKRDTVTINANVVKATHGETRVETLGSGNAAEPFQSFELKQIPLTHVSAPTASGTQSTLEVLVNGVAWRETPSLAGENERARKFVASTDDEGRTSVMFGDGRRGLRLPTGQGNVRATYRSGIGRQGNVKAKQISLLASRPLGVKEVINPVRASGGADRESISAIRGNAPASVTAFDRLVSVEDYADFARTFGGVGKAVARQVSDRRRGAVLQVTIAGDGDDPVDAGSDLFRNLRQALTLYGDDDVRVDLATRRRWAVIIFANVKLAADFRWEFVEPAIRAQLLGRFGFERMELGGTIFRSAVVAAVQTIEGVDYVDIDVFDALNEKQVEMAFTSNAASSPGLKHKISAGVASYDTSAGGIMAAGLAYLDPGIPDTLILQEIKS